MYKKFSYYSLESHVLLRVLLLGEMQILVRLRGVHWSSLAAKGGSCEAASGGRMQRAKNEYFKLKY